VLWWAEETKEDHNEKEEDHKLQRTRKHDMMTWDWRNMNSSRTGREEEVTKRDFPNPDRRTSPEMPGISSWSCGLGS